MGKLFTEFVGTFFLVLVIGLTLNEGTMLAAVAVGAMITALIYMGRHISGAHYNPAVTLALVLRGTIGGQEASLYVLSQMLGAVCASLMVLAMVGETFSLSLGEDVTGLAAVLAELLFTFSMTLVILRTATVKELDDNSYYGLAIGLSVVVGVLVAGPISGVALNPAVGLGPVLVELWMGLGGFEHLWIYLVGPFSGAVLAAVAFSVQSDD